MELYRYLVTKKLLSLTFLKNSVMFCHHLVAANASCYYYDLVVWECLELSLSHFIG